MAVTATVDKFGMTFADAYHKINRLTYESVDSQNLVYGEPEIDEDGNPVPPTTTVVWSKKAFLNFEVATYASAATREAHAEPIYRVYYNFEAALGAEEADLLAQAYGHLKAQAGYEDAVDC
jgi:hypothetical protein